jgi:hypothetical protein
MSGDEILLVRLQIEGDDMKTVSHSASRDGKEKRQQHLLM